MLSIIYPYRERDLDRIRFSLNSLCKQRNKDFLVYFVDYGSPINHASQVKDLLEDYTFVKYFYCFTEYQPWNKSKALNSVVKLLDTDYFFVADIDMIFHPSFIEITKKLSETREVWYFKVGFLSETESINEKEFSEYKVKFESNKEATGLTLCPTKQAQTINGFDEIYHFWGSEDTDFHVRLVNAGYKVNYYDKDLVMLHKWHKTYRNKEVNHLTLSLQVKGVVQFNQLHLKQAVDNKVTKVNNSNWGEIISEIDFKELQSKSHIQVINNLSTEVNYFVFQQLANLKSGVHHFQFKKNKNTAQLKKQLKQVLKFKQQSQKFYSLKEINDLVLFHIVNFYHYYSYTYQIEDNLKSINLSIKVN